MEEKEMKGTKKDKKTLENKKQKYIVIGMSGLIICGILLTSLPNPFQKKENQVTQITMATKEEKGLSYEEELEQRLEAILKKLEGAGKVQVMVTTSTTEEKQLAEDVTYTLATTDERDGAGGTRTNEKEDKQNRIVLAQGNLPVVVKETKPKVEGVLIVAEGGEDIGVKSAIIQAVSSLLNIPSYKVSVLKMVQN